jgi:hypothetical protein
MCYTDVTVRFRRGVHRADHRASQNLGDFISIGWSRQHVSVTLGARFAQYSRLRRADACARFCAPWRMYQVNVERSTPIVKILVWRVLSTTSVLSTTASRSRTGDICFRRGQTFALRGHVVNRASKDANGRQHGICSHQGCDPSHHAWRQLSFEHTSQPTVRLIETTNGRRHLPSVFGFRGAGRWHPARRATSDHAHVCAALPSTWVAPLRAMRSFAIYTIGLFALADNRHR